MKRYFLLTSVLALAACGGGGGTPSFNGNSGRQLTVRSAISEDAKSSNNALTSMSAEVLVPNDSSDSVITRAGSVHWTDGKTYTSYRLEDVNFRVATGANNAFLKFKVDGNGKIDSLVMNVGDVAGNQYMERNGDTSDFRGIVYEYVVLDNTATAHDDIFKGGEDVKVRLVLSPTQDESSTWDMLSQAADGKCPSGRFCRWDRIDQAFRVTSGSKEGSYGLKYADFGKLQTSNFGKYKGVTEENFAAAKEGTRYTEGGVEKTGSYGNWDSVVFDNDFDVFAGGYNVAALQHRPTEEMHFEGTAIGSLYSTNDATHDDDGVLLVDTGAKLDFSQDGTEKLTMDFTTDSGSTDENNWYKVTVTKNAVGTNNITFSNFSASGDPNFKFKTAETDGKVSVDNFTTTHGDDTLGHIKTEGLLDMGYYGVGATEEAAGIVRFRETANEGGTRYEHEFRAGYGMKPVEE